MPTGRPPPTRWWTPVSAALPRPAVALRVTGLSDSENLSGSESSIEHMFEARTDADLLETMRRGQRNERVAIAERLLAAGRLCQHRMRSVEAAERAQWCIDNWEAVAAEVAAELGISQGRASSQMNYGVQLIERLPKLGALFASGAIEYRIVITAVFRTGLITDADVLDAVDTRLAQLPRVEHLL